MTTDELRMSTVMKLPEASNIGRQLLHWAPVIIGFAALYVPTYVALANGAWNDEQNSHGPFVFAVIIWLFYHNRLKLLGLPEQGNYWSGGAVLGVGLLLFVVGRVAEVIYFEVASQIWVVAGILLLLYGWRGPRAMWFALLYMVFLVPLPGVVIDAATGPLKQWVSLVAESVLYQAGYPIARSGVVLTIGQYQLLVADACSGLNSMYSLSAMGMLFLYIMGGRGPLHTAFLLASILPIAFVANILRVMALVLVTYYFGDEAGQGFVHGFSGILLFVLSMLMLFLLHFLLGRALPGARKQVAA